MGGSTSVVNTNPQDISGLRSALSSWLQGGSATGGGGAQRPGAQQMLDAFKHNKGGVAGYLSNIPGGGGSDPFGTGYDSTGSPNRGIGGGANIFPPGGNQPGGPPTTAGTGLDRINANIIPAPDRVTIGQPGTVQDVNRGAIREVGSHADQIPGASTDFSSILSSIGPQFNRGQARDVGPVNIGPVGGSQSVDQLGGDKSAFFKNMVAQLSPAFNQRRAEGLAAAKEASGNLTGSGYANTLGSSINRSLGEEQGRLADYAASGVQTEVGRQLEESRRNAGLATSQAGIDLSRQQSNQGADLSFLQTLLGQSGQRLGAATSAAGLQQGGELANINAGTERARLGQSADTTNAGMDQFLADINTRIRTGNRDIGYQGGRDQAALDQERNMGVYNTQSGIANDNAQRFAQILSALSTAGVGQGQVVQSGGIGALLGPLAQGLGLRLGGR